MLLTLGFGLLLLPFRVFAFAGRHLEILGEPDPAGITQVETESPSHGEGLLDAFDFGLI